MKNGEPDPSRLSHVVSSVAPSSTLNHYLSIDGSKFSEQMSQSKFEEKALREMVSEDFED